MRWLSLSNFALLAGLLTSSCGQPPSLDVQDACDLQIGLILLANYSGECLLIETTDSNGIPLNTEACGVSYSGFFNVGVFDVKIVGKISSLRYVEQSVQISCTAPATLTVNTGVPANYPFMMQVQETGSGTGTVVSDVGGINCGVTCSGAVGEDAVVTLTAAASAGSIFSGWSGAGCSGTSACQVTVNQVQSVTAEFDLSP